MGRPRSGPVNDERLKSRLPYKTAIKAAKRSPTQEAWDKIHNHMVMHETDQWNRGNVFTVTKAQIHIL